MCSLATWYATGAAPKGLCVMSTLRFVRNDGGRAKAGYKGDARDCVCRAIAIAANRPYQEVYDRLAKGNAEQRKSKHRTKRYAKSARDGIYTGRVWFNQYMEELGFVWYPCMKVGSGCKVHLRPDEIPMKGRIIVSLSRHLCAVIDGVINDTYDPSRDGHRCVYGYWVYKPQSDFDTSMHPVRVQVPAVVQPSVSKQKMEPFRSGQQIADDKLLIQMYESVEQMKHKVHQVYEDLKDLSSELLMLLPDGYFD